VYALGCLYAFNVISLFTYQKKKEKEWVEVTLLARCFPFYFVDKLHIF